MHLTVGCPIHFDDYQGAHDMTDTAKFGGWACVNAGEALEFQLFEPKPWDDDDLELDIMYCGVCGTDASAVSGAWGPMAEPTVCGHEIVGKVTRVGTLVEHGIKVGDLVGVGPGSDACGECEWCRNEEDNFCPNSVITFGSPYKRGNGKGYKSRGGFANRWRGPSRLCVPIPDGLGASAAPMLCGGVTVFSPLVQYGAGTKAQKVGVIGIGGLGHFGILFAKAMGAEVTAFSRGTTKKADALALGADHYVSTGEEIKETLANHVRSLDLIICTINPEVFPLGDYLPLLRPRGAFVFVGLVSQPLQLHVGNLIIGNLSVAGSNVGSIAEMKKMFDFVRAKKIQAWINTWKMDDVNSCLKAFKHGDPRYRFVLVNEEHEGVM